MEKFIKPTPVQEGKFARALDKAQEKIEAELEQKEQTENEERPEDTD